MRFEKWHGLGNAYLLVTRPDAGTLDPRRVRRLCDPATGIGSDGIVEVLVHDDASASIAIWNPDGSQAEMSGNGTRIAAAWLLRETGAEAVTVAVGDRVVRAEPEGESGSLVRQQLGQVSVAPEEELDVAGERVSVIPVDVGNPHAVVLRHVLSRDELLRLGPAIEAHPRFPERTNVQLALPDGDDVVRVLVWERGAGETPASGSSATAVAAAAVTRGWCDSPVRIVMPGGELRVIVDGRRATVIGPVERICTGETPL